MEDSRKEILFLFPEFYKTNKGVNNFKTILGNSFELYERTIEEDNGYSFFLLNIYV